MVEYRYELTREVLVPRSHFATRKQIVFIMLNPSTADQTQDDPTIRRCLGFARREGAQRLIVVNLYAMRATKPAVLFAEKYDVAVGSLNDAVVMAWVRQTESVGGKVIAAWGAQTQARQRLADILPQLERHELWCLGKTQAGHPRHPLYVKGDQPLVPFP